MVVVMVATRKHPGSGDQGGMVVQGQLAEVGPKEAARWTVVDDAARPQPQVHN